MYFVNASKNKNSVKKGTNNERLVRKKGEMREVENIPPDILG